VIIQLALSENPLTSPNVRNVLYEYASQGPISRYPVTSAETKLKESLSQKLGVSLSSLTLGSGASEVIEQIMRVYCSRPGDSLVFSNATFIGYKLFAQKNGIKFHEVPINPTDLTLDAEGIIRYVRENENVRVVFISNPNNPTGTYLNRQQFEGFLDQISAVRNASTIVVMDYAYWEYVTAKDLPDPIPYLEKYPNLIVLKTFSKIYGLAGLRVGYGVASPAIASKLEKSRRWFNVNSLGLLCADAVLADEEFVKCSRQSNVESLQFWKERLNQLEIPFWGSQGNFILIDAQKGLGKTGAEVYEFCRAHNVMLGVVADLPHTLRISMGTMDQNVIAVDVLASCKKAT
jgi:histidinol-phosphate aminotransferase